MFRNIFSIIFIMVITTTASVCRAVPIEGSAMFSFSNWMKNAGVLHVNDPLFVGGTDDFTTLTNLVIHDFTYSPFVALNPLWESDEYSFAISSVVIETESLTALTLKGQGLLTDKSGNLDDTNGYWEFSGNGSVNWSSFTWSTSDSFNNVGVPAPAVLSIMSIGLFGVCFGTKRRKVT